MISINTRLLITSSLILICFLGLTGITLYSIFKDNVKNAFNDRLQGHVYALIAAAEITDSGNIYLPDALPEIRFSVPYSGLYGQITRNDGTVMWQSKSIEDLEIPFIYKLDRAEQQFSTISISNGSNIITSNFGISWDNSKDPGKGFTFSAGEVPDSLELQLSMFRKKLLAWLSAVTIVLLLVQTLLLRWGLFPLRHVSRELKAIEEGSSKSLGGKYPPELSGLTDSINDLLDTQHARLERQRNSLADLAHSLKTPLALLRGVTESSNNIDDNKIIEPQIERMSQIIEYQLQRAATSGRTALSSPIPLVDVITKITNSLNKVYLDKAVTLLIDIPEKAAFYGDEGDLMEVLGNCLDNAYKWCNKKVLITAKVSAKHNIHSGLSITIDDDGPGIPQDQIDRVLHRGIRADETISGHGIGLAIVQDIVQAYGGNIEIQPSNIGGTCIQLYFPGH
jgi:two-component system sensor histidine kinase PhoQ